MSNVDLTIQDVTTKEIKNLPKDITSSNFGKLNASSTNDDIVTGLINMVFEVIGMLAAFANRNEKNKDAVVIGTITTIPIVKEVFNRIEKIQNIKFIIPQDAEFATAIGAIRKAIFDNKNKI